MVKVQQCNRFQNCGECLGAQDPLLWLVRAGEQVSIVRACVYACWSSVRASMCVCVEPFSFSFCETNFFQLNLRQKVGSIEDRWFLVARKTTRRISRGSGSGEKHSSIS